MLLSFIVVLSTSAQNSLRYKVSAGWIDLGFLDINWNKKGDSLLVNSVSNVEVSYLVGKRKMTYKTKLLLISDVIITSDVDVYVNGALEEYTHTKKLENGYRIVKKRV